MQTHLKSTLALFCLLLAVLAASQQALAQAKTAPTRKSPLCSRDNALDMIRQQAALTKTFDNSVQRITVLVRAADLLWPYQQDRARAVFTEAFDLAIESEKEREQKLPSSIIMRLRVPDQRYVVIGAVGKRDSAWARELTQQMLKSAADNTAASKRNSIDNLTTSERLFESATQLITTNRNAALDLAAAALNYPAGSGLTRFLYRLAEVDQVTADKFYAQSLITYADKPLRELLYLQAYPFAWRDTLNTPVFVFYYEVPGNFAPDRALQRQLIQLLLRRAQQALDAPLDEADTYRNQNGVMFPATVHLWQGLTRLEPYVRESQPDLLPRLVEAREKILVSLSVETQKLLQPAQDSTKTTGSFDEQMELAEKEADPDERDAVIATTIFREASGKEKLDDLIQAIEKVSRSELRAPLLEYLLFQRAVVAITSKQFEEAKKLILRIEGHEQRAYLYTDIADRLLIKGEPETHVREVLEQAVREANKADAKVFMARTLLTAANYYAKIDLSRAIELLTDAVNCINRMPAPEFFLDDQALEITPERKGRGGQYQGEYLIRFYMPGLHPATAFRAMAKLDFDSTLALSGALTDKFQRAIATLAVAEECLRSLPPTKPKSKQQPKG